MDRDTNAELESQLSNALASLNEASRLRQVARESWDYFITNEFVYEAQGDQSHPFAGAGYLEQYLTSEAFFELALFRPGDSYPARAILEVLDPSAWGCDFGNVLAAGNLDIESMLVSVPQSVEDCEGVNRGIATVCWLKINDVGNCIGQDVNDQSVEIIDAPAGEVLDQGKCCVPDRLTPRLDKVLECEVPGDMVEGRAEVVHNIPKHGAKRNRRRPVRSDLVNEVVEMLRIELASEVLRVSIKEGPHLPIEFVKVLTRPFNLETTACDVHEVESAMDKTQHTPKGAEIPIPKRTDFDAVLMSHRTLRQSRDRCRCA